MKILVISDNFPPEVNAPASRTYEHCKLWVQKGADVTVITCAPNFPQGVVYPGYENKFFQREVIDGIKVIRVWTYIAENKGFIKRVLDYLSFSASSFFAGISQPFDIVIATSPQFFTTFSAYALSKLRRKPWVFELRDLWPESLVAVGALNNRRIIRWLERLEIGLYRDSASVVAVTEAFKENLVERGVDRNKIKVVTNGVNLSKFSPRPKDTELETKLGLKGKFVVGYIGTHGMAHGLDFIVRTLPHVPSEKIHFLFVGDGAEKQNVRSLAQSIGVANASFLDPVSKDEIGRYISLTDVALVPLRKSDTFKSVIPSKIFEFSAMGKPLLLGVDGQARKIVEQHQAGLFYEPENQHCLIKQLHRLYDDPELYEKLQIGCIQLAKSFDRAALAEKMLADLSEIVHSRADQR